MCVCVCVCSPDRGVMFSLTSTGGPLALGEEQGLSWASKVKHTHLEGGVSLVRGVMVMVSGMSGDRGGGSGGDGSCSDGGGEVYGSNGVGDSVVW